MLTNLILTIMKKTILKIFAAIAVAVTFCSCEGPMGPQGPKGDQGEGMNWEVLTLNCPKTAWSYVKDGGYFTAHFNVDALTKFICEEGSTTCYIVYSDGVQAVLPSTRYYSQKNSDDTYYYWSSTTDYEFYAGGVDVYYTASDFYDGDNPGDMTFRLVLQW